MHTWGVKKTLGEKEEHIRRSLEQGKRAIPINEKYGHDEWGAL